MIAARGHDPKLHRPSELIEPTRDRHKLSVEPHEGRARLEPIHDRALGTALPAQQPRQFVGVLVGTPLVGSSPAGADGRTVLQGLGLAIICFAYAQWLSASETQLRYGAVMKAKNGNPIHSPYATVANQHAFVVITLLKEYGFTPASRGKLPSRLIEHPDWTGLAN